MKNEEDEIDLIQLIKTVWDARKFILKVVFVFFLVGLFVALFSVKEFTSKTVFIPQTGSKGGGLGGLGGLAAFAGINLNTSSESGIHPNIYPKIVSSIPFKRELIQTKLNFTHMDKPVSYAEYFKKHQKFNLLRSIRKYTLGLPGLIIGSFRKEKEDKKEGDSLVDDSSGIYKVSKEENQLFKALSGQLGVNVNSKEGYVSLSFNMPEALPAAQMAKKAQDLLQKTITDLKTQKVKDELSFIQQRYDELFEDFKKKQTALARYKDRNVGLSTSLSKTYLLRLESEYNLSSSVLAELAKQLETQKIKVKEDTPVFTIIEPVSVPVEKSKPKRAMILVIWLFLGLVVGIGVVFGREWIRDLKDA